MGSNDSKLHAMNASDGTRAIAPFATGGAIQARAPVIPADRSTTALDIAYVTSQDGRMYAVNTNTGAQVWQSAVLGTQIQGGAAVWLQSVKCLDVIAPSGCGSEDRDVVFVGTRDSGSGNKVYGLNGDTGATLWTFNSGGTEFVGMISSTPYVDYTNSVVWVSSRLDGATPSSVWKLNAVNGAKVFSWNLGDIDGSISQSLDGSHPYFDGTFRYVGTNAGELKAIKVSDNNPVTHTPASGSGPIKGYPLSFSFHNPSPSIPDTIVFSRDDTIHAVRFEGATATPFSVLWTTTLAGAPTPTVSAPIDNGDDFNYKIYVGASDGKLHQLRLSDGVDEAQRTIVPGTPTVGDPSFDYLLSRVYVGATDGHIYAFGAPF